MLYRKLSAPISVQVEVTQICDNSCLHCYNYWWEGCDPKKLNTLTVKEIGYIINALAAANVFDVTFTGGEPLLFPEVVLAGIKLARTKKMWFGLNSNLTHLTPDLACRLRDLGLKSVLTSLTGHTAALHDSIVHREGAFDKTVHGIKIARSVGLRVSVNMVVTKVNQNFVLETGRLCASIGATGFGATRATAPGNCPHFRGTYKVSRETVRKHLDQLLQLKDEVGISVSFFEAYPICLVGSVEKARMFSRRTCNAGVTTAAIGANGEIRPCVANGQSYGNIFKEGLKAAWNAMTSWCDGSLIPETCKSCPFFPICSGGCRMDAQTEGDISGMDSHAPGPWDVIPAPPRNLEVNFPERMQLNPTARFRTEEFGGIIKVTDGGRTFLNADSYKLLTSLVEHPPFALKEIAQEFGFALEERNLAFLRTAVVRKILIAAE